jgi:hypothetical protein
MLGSPHTFGAIARVGPVASQTRKVRELLESPSRSAYLAVALGTEMAVTEALEVQDGLRARLGRNLAAVVVNALLPQRFTPAELRTITSLRQHPAPRGDGRHVPGDIASADEAAAQRLAVTDAAVRAAIAVAERARFQHNQLARLRRRDFEVASVPFMWGPQMDLATISAIARRLERALPGDPQGASRR